MIRIWRLSDPLDPKFASASRVGTWELKEGPALCPKCTASRERRVRPLIIEWEPGSDMVGDFLWPSIGDEMVVTERVMSELQARFRGFEPGPVEMRQNPKIKRPQPGGKRRKRRVWLPYDGPVLYDVWVTARVRMDLGRSTVRLREKCDACGFEAYDVEGIEKYDGKLNAEQHEYHRWKEPRAPGKGLYVRAADLKGADIFRFYGFGWILCTDPVKQLIEDRRFTNVEFLEAGEVV